MGNKEAEDFILKNIKDGNDSIKNYKLKTLKHGITELIAGAYISALPILLNYFSNINRESSSCPNFYEVLKTSVEMGGAYMVLEGLTDILFRQRKHHLLSYVLEAAGIHSLCVPSARDLEKKFEEPSPAGRGEGVGR